MNIFNILLVIMLLFNVNANKPRVYIRIPQYYTNVYVNNFINEHLLTNCYSFVETNLCELISDVYYDKEILEADYDANDTTGKSYDAQVGWLNMKWHDEESKYDDDLLKEYWEEFDDNVEYEKENR